MYPTINSHYRNEAGRAITSRPRKQAEGPRRKLSLGVHTQPTGAALPREPRPPHAGVHTEGSWSSPRGNTGPLVSRISTRELPGLAHLESWRTAFFRRAQAASEALLRPGSPAPARGRALVKGPTTGISPAAGGCENQPNNRARPTYTEERVVPPRPGERPHRWLPPLHYIRVTWGGARGLWSYERVENRQALGTWLNGGSQCCVPPGAAGTAAAVCCFLRSAPSRVINPPSHVGGLRREQQGILHPCLREGHLGLQATVRFLQEATKRDRGRAKKDPNMNYKGATSFTLKRGALSSRLSALSASQPQRRSPFPTQTTRLTSVGGTSGSSAPTGVSSRVGISKHVGWKTHNLKGKSVTITATAEHFLCSKGRSSQGVNWAASVIKEDGCGTMALRVLGGMGTCAQAGSGKDGPHSSSKLPSALQPVLVSNQLVHLKYLL